MHQNAALYFGTAILTLIGMTLFSVAIDMHKLVDLVDEQNDFLACEARARAEGTIEHEATGYQKVNAEIEYDWSSQRDFKLCADRIDGKGTY